MSRRGKWAAALGWAVFIVWVCTRRGDELPTYDFPGLDKIVHVGLYFVLGALLARASDRARIAVPLAILHGGFVEWLQIRVAGRSAEWLDWVADALGAVVGAMLVRRYRLEPPPQ